MEQKNIKKELLTGFTIIELIIVITIIAILAAIVLVNVSSYMNKGKNSKIESDVANMALGENLCYYSSSLVTPSYIGCSATAKYVSQSLATDIINLNGGTPPVIKETDMAYCISAPLASGSLYICTDSTGATLLTSTSICQTTGQSAGKCSS